MSQRLQAGAAVGMLTVAIGTLAYVGHAVLPSLWPQRPTVTERPAPHKISSWSAIQRGGRSLGPGSAGEPPAPVRIVVFTDFECPACRAAHAQLRDFRAQGAPRVDVVYRYFPLDGPQSTRWQAARAAECAAEQGAFDGYVDALFAEQQAQVRRGWSAIAQSAGVRDTTLFASCMATQRGDATIASDQRAGTSIGVEATPTLVINGLFWQGTPPREVLDSIVRTAPRS